MRALPRHGLPASPLREGAAPRPVHGVCPSPRCRRRPRAAGKLGVPPLSASASSAPELLRFAATLKDKHAARGEWPRLRLIEARGRGGAG